MHEIEEILLEEPPLRSSRKRSQSTYNTCRPVTEEAQWRQIMEERFTTYDYQKKREMQETNRRISKLRCSQGYDTVSNHRQIASNGSCDPNDDEEDEDATNTAISTTTTTTSPISPASVASGAALYRPPKVTVT